MKSRVKILTLVGTRPEAIKMAPVIGALLDRPEVEQKVVLSGQHRELLRGALASFDVRPQIDLELMENNQTLSRLTGRALTALDALYRAEKPDWVLVQGDTTTAMVASLAAFYLHIRVAHVEAGLRTDDLDNPFPEEMNRRFIDLLSSLYFAPTQRAKDNLEREHVPAANIHVTGNTGIDALLQIAERNGESGPWVAASRRKGWRLLLVTAHRRESFGKPLADICRALRMLVERNRDVCVLYPVHPNPNVREPVCKLLGGHERIRLEEALDYVPFVGTMKACEFILTDSGGIQEEAPSLGKPVLVLRETTERVEAIEAGAAQLVGTEPDAIVAAAERLLDDPEAYQRMVIADNPYGDGHASERIARILAEESDRLQVSMHRTSFGPCCMEVQR